jgi:hypothetical protein
MADEEAWLAVMQGHLRAPERWMMPQGAQRVAAVEGPMARGRLVAVPPGLLIELLAVAGEVVSLRARTDEVAHQAAARRV